MLIENFFIKHDILTAGFTFRIFKTGLESETVQEIYKLRYEVYCLECHYLPGKAFQAEKESDEYDHCSTHFATYATKKDIILGTVRLVQPQDEQIYPFEKYCKLFEEFSKPPRMQAAEASRLIVKKNYRRRQGNDKRLLLSMYKQMYRYSRQNNIRYWYLAMEDSLAHSVEKMGFKLIVIGPQADYYGPVRPYLLDLDEVMCRLKNKSVFLEAWFNDQPISIRLWIKTLFTLVVKTRFRKKR